MQSSHIMAKWPSHTGLLSCQTLMRLCLHLSMDRFFQRQGECCSHCTKYLLGLRMCFWRLITFVMLCKKIGLQCVHVSTVRLNVGFRHVRGCYDWRVDLDLALHFYKLENRGEDRREEMKGWKSIIDCLWLDVEINVLFAIGCKCITISKSGLWLFLLHQINTINDHKLW